MSISSAMYAGVSGLNAHGEAMGVVGDNIANLSTTGFKYSRTNFADLLAQNVALASGVNQVGKGTMLSSIDTIFSQGSIETSDDNTDVAINGNGFFILRDPTGERNFYTRDGNFSLNKDGYLVSANGYRVQGKEIDPVTGTASGIDVDIYVDQNYTAPSPTANIELVLNLNSNTLTTSSPNYYATSISVFDNLGNSHSLELTFTKSADYDVGPPVVNDAWTPSATLDGTAVTWAPADMEFDTNGNCIAGGNYTIDLTSFNIGTAAANLDLINTKGGSTTQYASSSVTNYASQDGYGPGYLETLSVNSDGILVGNYSNGRNIQLFQFTLARFNDPKKLHREGNNMWSETVDSGVPITGTPKSNGLGSITGNALEQSNVDLSEEFVKMILYQRAFQANSRIITTSDTLLEEILSLKR